MSVVVVATILPIPEHRDAVIATFLDAIPAVHGEDGCELYSLHEAADRLVMIEQWSSQEALDIHSKSDGLRAVGKALAGKIQAAPEVIVLNALPAGDASKGAVRP